MVFFKEDKNIFHDGVVIDMVQEWVFRGNLSVFERMDWRTIFRFAFKINFPTCIIS